MGQQLTEESSGQSPDGLALSDVEWNARTGYPAKPTVVPQPALVEAEHGH
jgi:hypothetical protein